jgi:4-amino-4-deoxy-L-arabinose transferase-like glycosyltransferase
MLRCVAVSSASLSFDEGATLYFARLPWGELFGAPARLEPNPPLFYALAHLVVATLGDAAWALRLPSIVAGTLCVPVAAFIARRVAGGTAGVIAAFLVATSAVGVVSSEDARAYAMLTLALLLAVAALVVVAGTEPLDTRRARAGLAWVVFVLAGTAGLYLHHTAALLLVALDGAALVVCSGAVRKRRFFWHLVAANAVIALLYLPWLPVTLGQMAGMPTNAWMTVPSLAGLRYAVLNIYAQPYAAGLEPWADLVFLAFGVAGVWAVRGNRLLVAMAFLLLGGVPIASWLISQVRPIMNGKTLLPLAPVFLVFVAVGCSSTGRWRVPVAAALVVVQLWSCRVFFADRPDEAFPAVAAVLRAQAAPGDRLVLARPELEILLHYYGWPRDRLAVFTPPAPGATPGTWFRGGTAQPGVPDGTGRIWLLSRSEASRQAALAKLGDVGPPVADELFGRGRMRNLELSLFQRGS